MYIPLNSTDSGQTVNYAVTASDYSKLTPTIMPPRTRRCSSTSLSTASRRRWTSSCSTTGTEYHGPDRAVGELRILQRPADLSQRKGRQRQSLRHPRRQRPAHGRHQDESIFDGRGVQSRPPVHVGRHAGHGPQRHARQQLHRILRHGRSGPVPRLQLHDLRFSDHGDERRPGNCGHGRRKFDPRPERARIPCHSPDDQLRPRSLPTRRTASWNSGAGGSHGHVHGDGDRQRRHQYADVTLRSTSPSRPIPARTRPTPSPRWFPPPQPA